MTKKDYVSIADAFKRAIRAYDKDWHNAEIDGVMFAARKIANTLAQDNPRFDRDKFLKACGVE